MYLDYRIIGGNKGEKDNIAGLIAGESSEDEVGTRVEESSDEGDKIEQMKKRRTGYLLFPPSSTTELS